MRAQQKEFVSDPPGDAPRRQLVERVGWELIAEEFRAGREVRFRVTGSSMVPTVWPGDVIVVRPVDAGPVRPGGLLLFRRDGRLVVHRVVGRSLRENSLQFITRGDAVGRCDFPVPSSDVVGVVRAVSRHGTEPAAAVGETSLAKRLVSFAVRRSQVVRRVVLTVHALSRRYARRQATRCQA